MSSNVNLQESYPGHEYILSNNEINEKVLKDMIDDVNQLMYSNTILHYACMKKSYKSVKALLEYNNININIKNSQGNTPLHIITEELFTKYLSVYLEGQHIEDLLGNGVRRNRLDDLKKIYSLLRDRQDLDLEVTNDYGESPIDVPEYYRPSVLQGATMDDFIDCIKQEDMHDTYVS